jgi:hypothetical protein
MIFRALVKQPQLGFEFAQHLGTMLALALGFGGIEAQDILLVAGFQADRIGLQGPGIADFGCYRLSRSTVPFPWGPK